MKGKEENIGYRALVICGGALMLVAVAVELLAVLGRLVGLPLPGSIELVQVAVTISGTCALLVATLHGSHARVRLVLDRLSAVQARLVNQGNALLSAVFFVLLCAGSIWLLVDLWDGFEESEIWFVPYPPLRLWVVLGTLAVALVFLSSLREKRS